LNQAVKRNADRFPDDFAFQLTSEEAADILKPQKAAPSKKAIRSQNVTASKRNVRFRPYAFTEHGAIMAANVLRSRNSNGYGPTRLSFLLRVLAGCFFCAVCSSMVTLLFLS
jgi:hypothetical protein